MKASANATGLLPPDGSVAALVFVLEDVIGTVSLYDQRDRGFLAWPF